MAATIKTPKKGPSKVTAIQERPQMVMGSRPSSWYENQANRTEFKPPRIVPTDGQRNYGKSGSSPFGRTGLL